MIRFWMYLLFVLAWFSVCRPVEVRRTRFKSPVKPKKSGAKEAIDKLAPAQNVDINQMNGKWYLISVASRCKTLLDKGFKVESTTITLKVESDKVSVDTVTKFNYECWEIKQNYMTTTTPGQLFLKGKRPTENMDVFVLDTDFISYAVLVFKRARKITLKLYGRSSNVADNIVDKFEDHAKAFGLGLDLVFQFPDYGFCESAEKVLEMT